MKPIFNPTSEQSFELEGQGIYNFVKHKEAIDKLVAEGRAYPVFSTDEELSELSALLDAKKKEIENDNSAM